MIARIITLSGNKASLESAQRCINSSAGAGNEFDIKTFEAVTAEQVPSIMNKNMFQWSYPIEGSRDDFATGMRLNSYPTAVSDAVIDSRGAATPKTSNSIKGCCLPHFPIGDIQANFMNLSVLSSRSRSLLSA